MPMKAKILNGLAITLTAGLAAFYQRFQGKSWWFLALISTLILPVLLDGIGDYSKSTGLVFPYSIDLSSYPLRRS